MKSRVTEEFIRRFARLPRKVQEQARKNYRIWQANPAHPSLHFKKIHRTEPVYAIRIGLGWRALGLLEGDTITWFWIGPHSEYDHLLR